MMTVTFVSVEGKKLGRSSFPCCPAVGSQVAMEGVAGEVSAVKFVPGASGVEAECTLLPDPETKAPERSTRPKGGK